MITDAVIALVCEVAWGIRRSRRALRCLRESLSAPMEW